MVFFLCITPSAVQESAVRFVQEKMLPFLKILEVPCWKIGWQLEVNEVFLRIDTRKFIKNVDVQDWSDKLINVKPEIIPSLHEFFLDPKLFLESQICLMLFRSL